MAYDDSRLRGDPAYRDEPDADYAYTPYATGSYPVSDSPDATTRHSMAPGRLDDVFDDPTYGDVGRDRMGIHLVWELILLLAVAGVGFLLYRDHRAAVTGAGRDDLMISAVVLGLLVLGTGLSLRGAAPNLAVGPIAYASALYFADHADKGLLVTAVQTGLLALAVGAVIALAVAGLHVPAWAASLGAGFGLMVWISSRRGTFALPAGVYQPQDDALYWFGGFVLLAFVGGVFGSMRGIRRGVGRFRPTGDPAYRRGGGAAAVCVLVLLGSSGLAAAGGILLALQQGKVEATDQSLNLLALSLGGALLAGTSAYGRRGGLFGGALAAVLITLVVKYFDVSDRHVAPLAVGAVAIGVGLIATRLVETYGRPRSTLEQEVEAWRTVAPSNGSTVPNAAAASENGWGGSRPTGWTSPLPASSADDRWGGDDWSGR